MVSIFIIGSVARNTSDNLSDRDILAVGRPSEVSAVISDYIEDGWNVTQYSHAAFCSMADAHSLFVQHVKQDGRVVRDDRGRLNTVLHNFRIKDDYSQELLAALRPIRSMKGIEESYWGKLFQSDVLYVAVRNACIFHRATVEDPIFDFNHLVSWISKAANLTSREENELLRLRSLKHAYRARSTTADVSCVPEIGAVAQKLVDYWFSVPCAGVVADDRSNGYYEVRNLEGSLVRAVSPIFLDKLGQSHELSDFWSAVCSSDPYRPRPKHLPRWSQKVSEFLATQNFRN